MIEGIIIPKQMLRRKQQSLSVFWVNYGMYAIIINPYKPSILFVGHTQSVQTQTRHSKIVFSLGSHCLLRES